MVAMKNDTYSAVKPLGLVSVLESNQKINFSGKSHAPSREHLESLLKFRAAFQDVPKRGYEVQKNDMNLA